MPRSQRYRIIEKKRGIPSKQQGDMLRKYKELIEAGKDKYLILEIGKVTGGKESYTKTLNLLRKMREELDLTLPTTQAKIKKMIKRGEELEKIELLLKKSKETRKSRTI